MEGKRETVKMTKKRFLREVEKNKEGKFIKAVCFYWYTIKYNDVLVKKLFKPVYETFDEFKERAKQELIKFKNYKEEYLNE